MEDFSSNSFYQNNLFNSLLNDSGKVLDGGEVLDDLGQDNQRVPDSRRCDD